METRETVIELTGDNLTIEALDAIAHRQAVVVLADSARARMEAARRYLERRMERGDTMYGVNTGFGAFSDVRISNSDLEKLQKNLVRSHAVGVGESFSRAETRAILALRANALARGHSGCRVAVVEQLLQFLEKDILPVIPQQGSVGASGDLAPLAHVALALIGEGEVWSAEGPPVATASVLVGQKLAPLTLQAKEGLSLINGCQVMNAVGILEAARVRRLLWLADLAGAMSLEALRGTRSAFDPLIAPTRPHPGEGKTARNLMRLLGAQSEISESHVRCDRVQDAYSLRCMPAVHGATKEALRQTWQTLTIEANSSTDNPLVFADADRVLSCGNFHGEPVAFALDFLAIAVAAMASMAECRIEKLINPAMSGLPAFLAPNGGLNSGLMIVQVAAAALVSENKILAHPASVDSIPTSADKEDHVSMGTIAARKLRQIVTNAENIVAMEILAAHQALGFLAPLKPAAAVANVHRQLANAIPFAEEDRIFAYDVQKIRGSIESGELLTWVTSVTGELEW